MTPSAASISTTLAVGTRSSVVQTTQPAQRGEAPLLLVARRTGSGALGASVDCDAVV